MKKTWQGSGETGAAFARATKIVFATCFQTIINFTVSYSTFPK